MCPSSDLIPPRPATPAFPEVVTQHPVAAIAVVAVLLEVARQVEVLRRDWLKKETK